MLELKKSNGKTAEKFLGQVEKSLVQRAEVSARRQGVTIECKDIDEVTTKKDVRAALAKIDLGIDLAIICEPYCNYGAGVWTRDQTGKAVIWAWTYKKLCNVGKLVS